MLYSNQRHNGISHAAQISNAAVGLYPKAFVLSCEDSCVPVEDIFVGGVARNFVNEDRLGNMVFACKIAGAKLILVMGQL